MKGIIGVLDYVEGLEESLRALVSALKPGGWTVFNVTITTVEGRIYALQELVRRRQINSRSPGEITALAEGVGLQVEKTPPPGSAWVGLPSWPGRRDRSRRPTGFVKFGGVPGVRMSIQRRVQPGPPRPTT